MTDKGLNFIDEYAKCTSSSWEDSKMYTSDSILNSQRTPTEIDQTGAIAKATILVEKVIL